MKKKKNKKNKGKLKKRSLKQLKVLQTSSEMQKPIYYEVIVDNFAIKRAPWN